MLPRRELLRRRDRACVTLINDGHVEQLRIARGAHGYRLVGLLAELRPLICRDAQGPRRFEDQDLAPVLPHRRFDLDRIDDSRLIKVVTKEGMPLAAGSIVTNLHTGEEFSIVAGGEAYVTGLQTSNQMRASSGKNICEFSLPYKDSEDSQRLGTFVCEPKSYAVQGVRQ